MATATKRQQVPPGYKKRSVTAPISWWEELEKRARANRRSANGELEVIVERVLANPGMIKDD